MADLADRRLDTEYTDRLKQNTYSECKSIVTGWVL
jgi:hypothetical protein